LFESFSCFFFSPLILLQVVDNNNNNNNNTHTPLRRRDSLDDDIDILRSFQFETADESSQRYPRGDNAEMDDGDDDEWDEATESLLLPPPVPVDEGDEATVHLLTLPHSGSGSLIRTQLTAAQQQQQQPLLQQLASKQSPVKSPQKLPTGAASQKKVSDLMLDMEVVHIDRLKRPPVPESERLDMSDFSTVTAVGDSDSDVQQISVDNFKRYRAVVSKGPALSPTPPPSRTKEQTAVTSAVSTASPPPASITSPKMTISKPDFALLLALSKQNYIDISANASFQKFKESLETLSAPSATPGAFCVAPLHCLICFCFVANSVFVTIGAIWRSTTNVRAVIGQRPDLPSFFGFAVNFSNTDTCYYWHLREVPSSGVSLKDRWALLIELMENEAVTKVSFNVQLVGGH
jgi:hypothetical protein